METYPVGFGVSTGVMPIDFAAFKDISAALLTDWYSASSP